MKTKIILCFICLLFCKVSQGQNPQVIHVTTKPSNAGVVIFEASNEAFCDYFVTVNLDRLSNTRASSITHINVKPGTSQVLRLSPLTLDQPVGYSYSFSYIKGNSNPKLDDSFLYLLPVKEGRTTNIISLNSLNLLLQRPLDGPLFAWGFSMNAGDTVYAARGGIVNQVSAGNTTPGTAVDFTRLTNSVEVFHGDGTFGQYNLLKNNGIFVKPGAKINAGDPIGVVEKVYANVYVGFAIYYLDQKKINNTGINVVVGYSTFRAKFALGKDGKGDYINHGESFEVFKPVSVVTQEMSKREREKFLETRKQ